MTINYILDTQISFDFDYDKVARKVIDASLKTVFFPYEVELCITLTDSDNIRRFNRDYRNIDKVTDVLSFPMIDFGADYKMIIDRTCDMYQFIEDNAIYINPDSDEVMLGDIVLCIPKLIEQAEEYGHSILREYAFLIVHSMLHLLGYDHINDDERIVMEDRQKIILDTVGILRA